MSWEEPAKDVAVLQWTERDVCVVFPLGWAKARTVQALAERAKARIAEVETKAGGKQLAPGSVLLAFSRHDEGVTVAQTIDPEAPHSLAPALVVAG